MLIQAEDAYLNYITVSQDHKLVFVKINNTVFIYDENG